jgi:nucleoside-diphosphate-sugar epimerase
MVEAEKEVIKAHQEGQYQATHFRYPMIYGPRQLAPHEWSILRRILDGRKRLIITNGGLTIRSQGYAENMAYALLLAVDKPEASSGQIYNLRDERLLTNRGWISLICKVMNYQFEFIEMPYSLARPARVYSWGHQHHVSDISKVKKELGYHDIVPVEKAIELTVKWLWENRPLPGGIVEQQLRDPFDYALEDRLMDEFMIAWRHLRDLQPSPLGFRHPYDHPEGPEDLRR